MAVALDAVSAVQVNFTTTVGWNHTATGVDRCVFVCCLTWHGSGTTAPTSITYGGNAMTLVGARSRSGQNYTSHIYKLDNPPTGSQAIAITWDRANALSTSASISFTGVHQVTSTGTYASADGNSTAVTVDVTSAVGDIVLDCTGGGDNLNSVGAGQTQRWNDASGATGGGSTEDGAATVTMSWTMNAVTPWVIGGVSVKAAPALPQIDPVIWLVA